MGSPGSWLAKPGLIKSLFGQARLAFRLIREPAVPALPKAVPALAAAYLIWPIDLLPDIFPLLGQLDDLGIVVLALELFLRLCPDAPAAFHRESLGAGRRYAPMPRHADYVDAEFRRD